MKKSAATLRFKSTKTFVLKIESSYQSNSLLDMKILKGPKRLSEEWHSEALKELYLDQDRNISDDRQPYNTTGVRRFEILGKTETYAFTNKAHQNISALVLPDRYLVTKVDLYSRKNDLYSASGFYNGKYFQCYMPWDEMTKLRKGKIPWIFV